MTQSPRWKSKIEKIVVSLFSTTIDSRISELVFDNDVNDFLMLKNELSSDEITAIFIFNTHCDTPPDNEKFIILNVEAKSKSISTKMVNNILEIEGVCNPEVEQHIKAISLGIYYGTYETSVSINDPFIEGLLHRKQKRSIHYNPYRNLEDAKSASWIRGWELMDVVANK